MSLVLARRTFEVQQLPRLEKFSTERRWKGYLTSPDQPVEIRVDLTNDAYAKIVVSMRAADSLLEVESISLTPYRPEIVRLLQQACGDRYIEKATTNIPVGEGLARLHVYHKPSTVAPKVEVQFMRAQDLFAFRPPKWFGHELVGDSNKDDRHVAFEAPPAQGSP